MALALASAPAAMADNVQNNAQAAGNSTFTAGGSTTIAYFIQATNGDLQPNTGSPICNAGDGTSATVTITVPAGVTANPSSLVFTACGTPSTNTKSVVFSSSVSGSYPITASVSDSGVGTYNVTGANFTLTVSPLIVTNTAPTVTVTGVTIGATYAKSSVPAAGCSVVDAEDGTPTVSPILSTPSLGGGLGQQSATCSYTDTGGLGGSDSISYTIVADPPVNKPPTVTVSGVTADASYEIGSVPSATCQVTDTEDGPSSFAATLSAITGPLSAYGLGSQTASCSYTDDGGLTDTDSATYSIVDTTDPTIVLQSRTPAANANGWNKADVTLVWACSDSGSGVVAATDTQTVSTEGANQEATGTCTDNAGNSATNTVSDVSIDKTDPVIAFKSRVPAPNADGWNKASVTVTWDCTDALSGVVDTTTSDTVTTEGENQTATGTCTDNADNSASASVNDVSIDKTNPAVVLSGPTDAATYLLGQVPATQCATSDALSGVKTASTASVTGGTVNGVGQFTATCGAATDKAGNSSAPVVVTYQVNYANVSGILQPINPDNTSVFKRGQAVPVKLRLGGDEPAGFSTAAWSIQRQSVACTVFDGADAQLEDVPSNTPASTFRYDTSADQYIYNADMKTAAIGSCWNFKVTLDSGQSLYSAVFKLAK